MSNLQDGAAGAARRAQIEAVLADYPDISEDRLAAVIRWFRKEASALDVATLASNEAIADRYRRFRTDHIDSVSGNDVIYAVLGLALGGAVMLALVWPAL